MAAARGASTLKSVFIMSSERSGSNLVRRILGAHPDLVAPPPPHLWKVLAPLCPTYGPLTADAFRAMVEDARAIASIPDAFTSWDYVPPAEEVVGRSEGRSLSHAAVAMYDAYAHHHGADGWVNKGNNIFDHAFAILHARPQAKFVYLVRDGRDVLASFRRVPHYRETTIDTARRWRDEQLTALRVHQALEPVGASIMIRYEDLIEDAERTARSMMEHVDLEFDPSVLDFHKTRDAEKEAAGTDLWKNLAKPVMRGNAGRFRTEVPRREIKCFERIAGTVLDQVGYPPEHSGSGGRLSLAERARIRAIARLRFAFKPRTPRESGRRARMKGLDRLQARADRRQARFARPVRVHASQRAAPSGRAKA